MSIHLRRRAPIVAALLSAWLVIAGAVTEPASAAPSKVRDPADAAAPVDIRSMSASVSRGRMVFRIKVADLQGSGAFIAHWHGEEIPGNEDSGSEQMVVVDRRDGRTSTTLWSAIELWRQDSSCPGIRSKWRVKANLVVMSVPLRCSYFHRQTLRLDGHSMTRFDTADDQHVDEFPPSRPDLTAHFGLAVP